MKRIFDITLKDLTELTRNWMTFLFLLLMPVVFTLLFGFAFSGVGRPPEDPRLPVGFLNQDDSPLSEQLRARAETEAFLCPAGCSVGCARLGAVHWRLGLLIGVLAKNDEQAIMFLLLLMLVLSALGGAWVPLDVAGPAFRAIGHLSPVSWALDGFENIARRGLGFESVLLLAAMLIGYAVLFFGLAVWRFRRVSGQESIDGRLRTLYLAMVALLQASGEREMGMVNVVTSTLPAGEVAFALLARITTAANANQGRYAAG